MGSGDTALEAEYDDAARGYASRLINLGKLEKARFVLSTVKSGKGDLMIRLNVEEGSLEAVRPMLKGETETEAWTEALVEYVSLSLGEEGSGLDILESKVKKAVAGGWEEAGWRLAWPERIGPSDGYDGYAATEQLDAWHGTEGAVIFLKQWLLEWVERTGGGKGHEEWRAAVGEIFEDLEKGGKGGDEDEEE